MASFGVDSLFTKVSFYDVFEFFSRKLPDHTFDLGMPRDTVEELLRLCVTSNDSSLGSDFYMQCFCMKMGSHLSPVVSNLYIDVFFSFFLRRFYQTFHPFDSFGCVTSMTFFPPPKIISRISLPSKITLLP